MSWNATWPLITILCSLLPALLILTLDEARHRLRNSLNLGGAVLKLTVVGLMLWGVYGGTRYGFGWEVLPGLSIVLRADALALLFLTLSALLWLLTTIYAISYLGQGPDLSRFFGFFCLCVAATAGIALAGNLFTLLIFYELLTLSTYPLVVHKGDRASLAAGYVYLRYTLAGGALVLLGTAWLHALRGSLSFAEGGGALEAVPDQLSLQLIFWVLILGFGVKAALVPLHGWLPRAMVAPAPVSALLHAVAVVKAGAFGIIRVIYDVYGLALSARLGVLTPLAWLAALTIVYGSVQALRQDDIKRRLAYSTVSQLSYIVLGTALLSPLAGIGGLAHLVHQGVMKITMFFCAGALAETLGIHRVSELNGAGRRMPLTMLTFSIAGLAMVGVPPLAGFISKWQLGVGALESGNDWVVPVLLLSSLLNAAYFLPIIHRAWFLPPEGSWPQEAASPGRLETAPGLLWPALITAALTVLFGLFAGSALSPLHWATFINEQVLP
ncbi:proton-conducting transporter membrane subunit [Alkalilimnicola sp. S0819]|uniref:proton-conducting transporter transmembrane domain-containing protein n=1 Tax=Alkalilimnicola sp. S0819 TaxID=2613922 RepID=UPI0012614BF7|nr:proton-conducting transporter membrane subunit [Alkalilimnicola sp. S0819]KAB7627476.1 monovalent cation/H+ antiporter subunit D family protein [Alkalilimnicola sp. S0819]MPQ15628.1 monovalent cation/H+ antiporter subunit D family protein [Alkalilimnicola sp. S0819]